MKAKKRSKKTGKKSVSKKSPVKKSGSLAIDYQQLDELLKYMKDRSISQFEWQKGDQRISLATGTPSATATVVAAPEVKLPSVEQPVATPAANGTNGAGATVNGNGASAAKNSNSKEITSPFVGTFYRAPSPESAPYVKEGQAVSRGDVLCIVEAMKLMNEIESELSGKVIKVYPENGQPVEYGELLFEVET